MYKKASLLHSTSPYQAGDSHYLVVVVVVVVSPVLVLVLHSPPIHALDTRGARMGSASHRGDRVGLPPTTMRDGYLPASTRYSRWCSTKPQENTALRAPPP